MIKNIPNKYTINSLAEEIDRYHSNCYDFLYLPCDIKVSFSTFRYFGSYSEQLQYGLWLYQLLAHRFPQDFLLKLQ